MAVERYWCAVGGCITDPIPGANRPHKDVCDGFQTAAGDAGLDEDAAAVIRAARADLRNKHEGLKREEKHMAKRRFDWRLLIVLLMTGAIFSAVMLLVRRWQRDAQPPHETAAMTSIAR